MLWTTDSSARNWIDVQKPTLEICWQVTPGAPILVELDGVLETEHRLDAVRDLLTVQRVVGWIIPLRWVPVASGAKQASSFGYDM